MPDYLHCNCPDTLRRIPDAVRQRKSEQVVWQHRYWERQIRDETDFARHADYIHYNPVKHGLVQSSAEWPYSSFGRYVKAGIYVLDWEGDVMYFSGVGRK